MSESTTCTYYGDVFLGWSKEQARQRCGCGDCRSREQGDVVVLEGRS